LKLLHGGFSCLVKQKRALRGKVDFESAMLMSGLAEGERVPAS
jgi:hypothetical protein